MPTSVFASVARLLLGAVLGEERNHKQKRRRLASVDGGVIF